LLLTADSSSTSITELSVIKSGQTGDILHQPLIKKN
jgi:hypothetical protein